MAPPTESELKMSPHHGAAIASLVARLREAIATLDTLDRQLEAQCADRTNASSPTEDALVDALKELHGLGEDVQAAATRSLRRYGRGVPPHPTSTPNSGGCNAATTVSEEPARSLALAVTVQGLRAQGVQSVAAQTPRSRPSGDTSPSHEECRMVGAPANRTCTVSRAKPGEALDAASVREQRPKWRLVLETAMSLFDEVISLLAWVWAFIIPYGVGLGMGPGAGGMMRTASLVVCALFGAHAVLALAFASHQPREKLQYAHAKTQTSANSRCALCMQIHRSESICLSIYLSNLYLYIDISI